MSEPNEFHCTLQGHYFQNILRSGAKLSCIYLLQYLPTECINFNPSGLSHHIIIFEQINIIFSFCFNKFWFFLCCSNYSNFGFSWSTLKKNILFMLVVKFLLCVTFFFNFMLEILYNVQKRNKFCRLRTFTIQLS